MKSSVAVQDERNWSFRDFFTQNKDTVIPLLECLEEAIEVSDADGQIIYVNRAFEQFSGRSAAEWLGKGVFDYEPENPLARLLTGSQPFSGRKMQVHRVEAVVNGRLLLTRGSVTGAIISWQPLTNTYRLQEELRQDQLLIDSLYSRLQLISRAKGSFADIIGNSKAIRGSLGIAYKAAKTDSPVVIWGQPGTGKELFAQAIHQASQRRDKPFIKLDCAGIPENQLETELFGREPEDSSGRSNSKLGHLELANSGTLYLTGVLNLSLAIQKKLIRLLDYWEFFRVGGLQPVKVDLRLIVAADCDLRDLVQSGKLSQHLYNRLNTVELALPALRQRREDISLLVNYFVDRFNRKIGREYHGVSDQALQSLVSYEWPGNVRELMSVLERAMLSARQEQLTQADILRILYPRSQAAVPDNDIIPLRRMEEILLRSALAKYGENLEGKKKAAEALHISLATLYNKLKRYNL